MSEPRPEKMEAPAQSNRRRLEHFLYKNRLQEYAHRSSIPLPMYQTINQGAQHSPKFRSIVWIDGRQYTSPHAFSHRKAAEQDVARVALLGISRKIKDEGILLIREDTIFCKSILNEYAAKLNLEKPTYETVQSEGLLPIFVSSLVFNGVAYTGDTGRSKKEAEQLAARAVILSILESQLGTTISEIIKSKFKLYAALNKVKDSCSIRNGTILVGIHPGCNLGIPSSEQKKVKVAGGTDNMATTAIPELCLGQPTNIQATQGKEVKVAGITDNMATSAIPEPSSGQPSNIQTTHPPVQELRTPKQEASSEAVITPVVLVPPVLDQPLPFGSMSGKKRNRKNKKKSKKKVRVDAQLAVAVLPLSQVPTCSVAQ